MHNRLLFFNFNLFDELLFLPFISLSLSLLLTILRTSQNFAHKHIHLLGVSFFNFVNLNKVRKRTCDVLKSDKGDGTQELSI